ncbi:DUF6492 family protein [Aureimonas populi]|uniref:DUF6492 family protein n=1 Tax=Aureimonas populi TaxID=1701758 RepID=A0ABW5CJQ5_9HYPH|nr:DUF6492 family protein [Aureimonas populi]
MTHPATAIVTASYRGDLERCRLLCDSIDRHVSGHARHYLLVEGADAALFRPFEGPRRTVVSERDLLPFWLRAVPDPLNPRRRLWLSPFGPPLRGWHVQQLRRIAFARLMDEAAMISCDSDVVFVRPFDMAGLWREGALRFYRVPDGFALLVPEAEEEHTRWSRKAAALLGIAAGRSNTADHINTVIGWRADTAREMAARIEAVTGRPALRALAATRSLSECTIYGRFVDEVEERPERHWPSAEALCRVYWAGAAMDEGTLSAFLGDMAPHEVALGIQSFTGTNTALIRSLVGLA